MLASVLAVALAGTHVLKVCSTNYMQDLAEHCSVAIPELLWCMGNTSVTSDRGTRFKSWQECPAVHCFFDQQNEVL